MNGAKPVFCEMHETESKILSFDDINQEDLMLEQSVKINDLCSICEKNIGCTWRKEKDFVFECEEYE